MTNDGDVLEVVNGLDERMGYWAEDRELGERLMNLGIKPKQIRYDTTCVHLDHERPYRDAQVRQHNMSIRRETRSKRAVWTDHGITRLPSAQAAQAAQDNGSGSSAAGAQP